MKGMGSEGGRKGTEGIMIHYQLIFLACKLPHSLPFPWYRRYFSLHAAI